MWNAWTELVLPFGRIFLPLIWPALYPLSLYPVSGNAGLYTVRRSRRLHTCLIKWEWSLLCVWLLRTKLIIAIKEQIGRNWMNCLDEKGMQTISWLWKTDIWRIPPLPILRYMTEIAGILRLIRYFGAPSVLNCWIIS